MAFPSADTVKILLGITSTTYDDMLDIVLPSVIDEIKEYCNTDFLDDDDADIFPTAGTPVVAQMCGYWIGQSQSMGQTAGVKSFSEGGYSETRADVGSSGYPEEIIKKLDKWKIISMKKASVNKEKWRDYRGYLTGGPAWYYEEEKEEDTE